MDEFINQLKEKYNYNDKLIELLYPIITNMTEYFGEESKDKILGTFMDVPIHFVETREDIIEYTQSLGIKDEYILPTVASGGYEEYFQLNDNKNVQRIPFILIRSNYAKDKPDEQLAILIHEICHAIMNYNNAIIEGNKIHSKTGLIEEEIEILDDEIKTNRKTSVGKNVAIEEGLNEYDARCITRMVLGRDYETSAYGTYVSYVKPVMDNEEVRKLIDYSRLNNTDEWKEVLGEELSQEFMDSLTNWVNTILASDSTDEEKNNMKEIMVNTYQKIKSYMEDYNNTKKRA